MVDANSINYVNCNGFGGVEVLELKKGVVSDILSV
jgi:hypothetical protein